MRVEFSELQGLVCSEIKQSDTEVVFTTNKGVYILRHDQDCCESVDLEDVCGDLDDLLNEPILLAEEVSYQGEDPIGFQHKKYAESWTWTFYKLSTNKGSVTLRWYGTSNGYYSERVDLYK